MSRAEFLTDTSVIEVLKNEIDSLRDSLAKEHERANMYEQFYLATFNRQGHSMRARAELLKAARAKIEASRK